MREKKYYLVLDNFERRLLLNNLNNYRNKLIAEKKYTDLLDEVIIKVANSKLKRVKVRRLNNGNYIYNAGRLSSPKPHNT